MSLFVLFGFMCFHNQNYSRNIMNCTSRNMTFLPYISTPVAAETVFLDDNNLHSLLAPFFYFASVGEHSLNKSNISSIESHAFKHLSQIKTIYQDNNIHEVGTLVFSNLTTL